MENPKDYIKQLEAQNEQLKQLFTKSEEIVNWLWHRPKYFYIFYIEYGMKNKVAQTQENISRSLCVRFIRKEYTFICNMDTLPNILPEWMCCNHKKLMNRGLLITKVCIMIADHLRPISKTIKLFG